MNKGELQTIIRKWWVWNSTQSQTGEAYQFEGQIRDWESGFTQWQKDGWVGDTSFTIVKVKGVKEGLSIRLESDGGWTDGILNIGSGVWIEKSVEGNELGEHVMRGASIDGGQQ